jgi:hypothetical protein
MDIGAFHVAEMIISEELRERLNVFCGSAELADIERFLSSPAQTALRRIDALTPDQVAERLVEIVHAHRRKILHLPGGATPNMQEWTKLLKCFFAHTQLAEHFNERGLPTAERYRWPVDKGYGKAFVLFDSGLDHRGVAAELGISDAHAKVLRSYWRRAIQRGRRA